MKTPCTIHNANLVCHPIQAPRLEFTLKVNLEYGVLFALSANGGDSLLHKLFISIGYLDLEEQRNFLAENASSEFAFRVAPLSVYGFMQLCILSPQESLLLRKERISGS